MSRACKPSSIPIQEKQSITTRVSDTLTLRHLHTTMSSASLQIRRSHSKCKFTSFLTRSSGPSDNKYALDAQRQTSVITKTLRRQQSQNAHLIFSTSADCRHLSASFLIEHAKTVCPNISTRTVLLHQCEIFQCGYYRYLFALAKSLRKSLEAPSQTLIAPSKEIHSRIQSYARFRQSDRDLERKKFTMRVVLRVEPAMSPRFNLRCNGKPKLHLRMMERKET